MSKILVLNGNPKTVSFCAALADSYEAAARSAGHEVRRIDLQTVPVSLVYPDYSGRSSPESWVAEMQQSIAWSDHWVIVAPMWWGGPPAGLKAFFDSVLTPGFAFRYRARGLMWDKLMSGRSARAILLMDTPGWVFHWILGRPMVRQIRAQILGFCGFKPVRTMTLGPIKTSSAAQRDRWLVEVAALGAAGQ